MSRKSKRIVIPKKPINLNRTKRRAFIKEMNRKKKLERFESDGVSLTFVEEKKFINQLKLLLKFSGDDSKEEERVLEFAKKIINSGRLKNLKSYEMRRLIVSPLSSNFKIKNIFMTRALWKEFVNLQKTIM